MANRTDTETQIKALALIARGDTYKEVSASLGIPISTLQDIKKRNESTLALIQERMIDHQVSSSRKILDKAQKLIEKKLDKASTADEQREELLRQRILGEIDSGEFQSRMAAIYEPTLTELNSVSKESFTQSQIEQGKPTSISSAPREAQQQLVDLVAALQDGDEIELYKMVLNPDKVIEGEVVQ